MLTLQIQKNDTFFRSIVRENDTILDVCDFDDAEQAQDYGLKCLEAEAGERANRIAELTIRFREMH